MALLRAITWGPQGVIEISSSAGTLSFVTSPALGAGASLRTNPTTTGTGLATIGAITSTGAVSGFWDAVDTYLQFVFQVATLPSADNEPICNVLNTLAAQKMEVRINSAGNLLAYDQAGVLLATGSTALSTGTPYRIGVRCGTGASANWAVEIDGVSEISGTGDLGGVNSGVVQLGKVADRNGESVDFYYGTVWIDDAAFLGACSSAIAVPTANGSTMQWTAGTGGSDYQEVDEIPPSGAEYVMSASGAGDVALFDVQDSGTVGVSGTIHAVIGLVRVREDTTVTSACSIRIRSGSTNSDSSTSNTTTTAGTRARQLVQDPDTSAAWTTSGFDGVEIGAVEANTVAQRMEAAYIMVVFTEGEEESNPITEDYPDASQFGRPFRPPVTVTVFS